MSDCRYWQAGMCAFDGVLECGLLGSNDAPDGEDCYHVQRAEKDAALASLAPSFVYATQVSSWLRLLPCVVGGKGIRHLIGWNLHLVTSNHARRREVAEIRPARFESNPQPWSGM